jgi:hypothetical protein
MMVEAVTLVGVVGGDVEVQSVIVVAIGWVAEIAVWMMTV